MKLCQCCSTPAEEKQATCANCGEASWKISVLIVAPEQLDSVMADPAWTAHPQKYQSKRR